MNLRLLYLMICVLSYRFSSGQRLVSRGKTISSSSFVNTWTADKAVDGDARRAPLNCDCCAATRRDFEPWYKLDLGQQYNIYSISVLGRGGAGDAGYGHTLKNMQIKLGTTQSNGQEITQYTGNGYTYDYTLPTPRDGRYLTLILLNTTQYFIICELSVYAVCDGNTYGPDCVHTCGNCIDGETCDTVNGSCPDCATGYKAPLCQECDDGYFGNVCTQRCYCLNSPCDKTTGICPIGGCAEGYKEDKCSTPCEYGEYGKNCAEICGSCYNKVTCNRFNGSCQRCAPGYMGSDCKHKCQDGKYGLNCDEQCGHCFEDEICNHVDGHCASCAAGYKGSYCKDECDTRTFGLNCSRKCGHCLNSFQCHTVNGSCPSGCDPGFKGALCDATCDKGKYGEKCANSCGNCYQQDTCDAVTGLCTNNCSAGYTGTHCKQECKDGTYGLKCDGRCGRCLNGQTCDKRNGICSQCEHGYMEPLCKVPENAEYMARCPEVKSYQLATAVVGTIAGVVIIGNVVAAICYMNHHRRKHREGPIQSQPDNSNPYELANRGAFETEHQYGQTAPVYEEPEAPYEIPK